jgi:hypothetical protein
MMVIGVDAHKRTHTAVGVDQTGRQLSTKTIGATSKDHLSLLRWATEQSGDRLWAIEDCRHLSRRLERDLIAAGERIVRVPPKLMANVRDGARTYGKSDPIDALAVARAALREPICPKPASTAQNVSSGFWSTIARTSLPNGLASSHDCAGTFTSSTQGGRRRRKWTGPARSIRFKRICRTLRALSQNWRPDSSSTYAASLPRSTNSRARSLPGPLCWPLPCWRFLGADRSLQRSWSVRLLVSIDFTPRMRSHGTTGPRRFRYGRRTALDIDSRAPGTVSSMPQSTASHSLRPAVIPTLEHCWHVARPAARVEWKHSASSNADCRTSSSKRWPQIYL